MFRRALKAVSGSSARDRLREAQAARDAARAALAQAREQAAHDHEPIDAAHEADRCAARAQKYADDLSRGSDMAAYRLAEVAAADLKREAEEAWRIAAPDVERERERMQAAGGGIDPYDGIVRDTEIALARAEQNVLDFEDEIFLEEILPKLNRFAKVSQECRELRLEFDALMGLVNTGSHFARVVMPYTSAVLTRALAPVLEQAAKEATFPGGYLETREDLAARREVWKRRLKALRDGDYQ